MAAGLDVRLRILLPLVENSVAGNAFRPLDVLQTRKGITVEVGNTDAEGRLILADALTEADREKPELLCDFATLTGAARTALGTELPALFSNNRELSLAIQRAGEDACDPVWALPLWQPYRDKLSSKVATLNNISEGPYAGAITAALFLNEFVSPKTPWAHLDFMGWNDSSRPGRPEGGEAQGMRGFYRAIATRFGG
jgi:leucyl aminopeptidase